MDSLLVRLTATTCFIQGAGPVRRIARASLAEIRYCDKTKLRCEREQMDSRNAAVRLPRARKLMKPRRRSPFLIFAQSSLASAPQELTSMGLGRLLSAASQLEPQCSQRGPTRPQNCYVTAQVAWLNPIAPNRPQRWGSWFGTLTLSKTAPSHPTLPCPGMMRIQLAHQLPLPRLADSFHPSSCCVLHTMLFPLSSFSPFCCSLAAARRPQLVNYAIVWFYYLR